MAFRLLVSGVVGLALLLSAPVLADSPRVTHQKETVVDFTEVPLEGSLRRPEGKYVLTPIPAEFCSLIRLREHFLNEIRSSTDNL